MIQIEIPGHLIIPFGRPKWVINKIQVSSVSPHGTSLSSEIPCVHIDKTQQNALRLTDFAAVNPEELPFIENAEEGLAYICKWLKTTCQLDTKFEERFLDLYFDYCNSAVTSSGFREWCDKHVPTGDWGYGHPEWVFRALLPLPQAHFYLYDPLLSSIDNMFKIDFLFWTGLRFVAVEIDGSSHVGSERHIQKDRMLDMAGIKVVHILNSELFKHGRQIIWSLLPPDITGFWRTLEDGTQADNPFIVPHDYISPLRIG